MLRTRIIKGARFPDVDTRLFVSSAEKCLSVLKAFGKDPRPLSLKEIGEISSLDPSSTQRFVYTLKSLGFLEQNARSKRYFPSAQVLDLSYGFLMGNVLREVSAPHLREAHRLLGESINLVQLDDSEIIYISRISDQKNPAIEMEYGSRLPVYCSSSGRAILAYLEENTAKDILTSTDRPKRTRYTEVDLDIIMSMLNEIRNKGYAVNNQECFIGDLSIATPVFDKLQQPVGAINISLSSVRWDVEEAKSQCVPVLMETAGAISKQISHS